MKKIGELLVIGTPDEAEIKNLQEKLLKYFSGKYIFVYYINVEKKYSAVRMVTENMNYRTVDALEQSENFLETFKEATGRLVHPDDREMIMNVFDPEYCTRELRKKKSFSRVYRWNYYEEDYKWNRVEISKLEEESEEPKNIIIGCENVDAEQRKALAQTELTKQYQSGIYALSKEYSSVYYVNLDEDRVTPFNLSNRIEGMFGDQFYNLDYSKAIKLYVDRAVIDNEKSKMLHILSPEYVIRKLKETDYFTKIYLNNDNEYCEMKVVKVEQDDDSNVCVMGFGVKDKAIRQEQQQREEFALQYTLLDGLSHEYNSVWLVKPNRKMELFRVAKIETREMVDAIREQSEDAEDVARQYIDHYVVKEDREELKRFFSFDTLMQTVPEREAVKLNFRRITEEGEYRYIQAVVTKTRDPHGWANLIIAFRDVDDIIRYQKRQEAALDTAIKERDHDALTKLKNRYYYDRQLEVYSEMDYSSITCIYIDVNGLHEVNNTHGHEAGDDMLRRVALYIAKIWGEENSYRIGGDEFVIFAFDQEMEDIHKDVDGFNKALQTYGYSASLGYAREEGRVDDIQGLIRDAETEMYRAKKNHYKGKNDRRRH